MSDKITVDKSIIDRLLARVDSLIQTVKEMKKSSRGEKHE